MDTLVLRRLAGAPEQLFAVPAGVYHRSGAGRFPKRRLGGARPAGLPCNLFWWHGRTGPVAWTVPFGVETRAPLSAEPDAAGPDFPGNAVRSEPSFRKGARR